jgi:membrane-bound serine protease (ClpP class)
MMPPLLFDNVVVDFSEGPKFFSSTVLIPLGICLVLVGLLVYFVVDLSRREKPRLKGEELLGLTGKALDNIAPEGKVYVHGEIWHARTVEGLIAKDELLVVTGIGDGLVLEVKKK